MAKGTEIIVSSNPKGYFDEGIINDTSKPGMIMDIVAATAFATLGGRPKYAATTRTAGAKGGICVLLADSFQGKLGVGAASQTSTSGGSSIVGPAAAGDAYVAGTRCFLYWPIAGEELNLLVGDVAGTADTIAIGDLYGVNNNGKLIKNSSYTSAPFVAMEATNALAGDSMIWFKYLGNQA